MLYFALRAYGFLITKHKHKNNNLLSSLTPLVLYSFSPLPYSFIHLPAVFAPYFPPFPSLSLSHFAACVRSSHCPRVTSCTFSLSSPSFPFLFSLSSSPPLQPAIIFLSHTQSLPSLLYFDSPIISLLSYFSVSLSVYLFIHLLLVHFLAESSSYSLLLLANFLQFLLSLIPSKPVPGFICIFLYPIFTIFPLSLSSLANSLNFFCVSLSSFVKSSSIYILSPFFSFNLLLLSIMFFCSQLSIFASIILSLFILNASFTFTFTPISRSNHSSTPLSIFPLLTVLL
jgi:hypothetical protein